MSIPTIGLFSGLVRGWVDVYTSGLPAPSRDARRAEIESDLWEQQRHSAAAGMGRGGATWHVLARFLLGIPADLSWRLAQESAARHPNKGGKQVVDKAVNLGGLVSMGFTGLVVLLGLMALSTGVGGGLGLIDNEHGTIWMSVALSLSAGVALLAGIWTIRRSALLGGGLVVFGVIVIGLGTLWTIIVPIVMALLAIGAAMRAMRVGRERNSLLR